MKHIYISNRKPLQLFASIVFLFFTSLSWAQSPTTVLPTAACAIVQDFNTSDGGFGSPSAFSDAGDRPMFYFPVTGNWHENLAGGTRNVSIISPTFSNPSPNGTTIVGFKFTVPPNTEYKIRVISNPPPPALTKIIANTGDGTPPLSDGFRLLSAGGGTGELCVQLTDADLLNGAPYLYEITFKTPGGSDIAFDDFKLGGAVIPLPVNFMEFNVERQSNSNRLVWKVGQESNLQGYQVERSSNGKDFNTLSFVPANGQPIYTFVDNQALNSNNFYRIKSVNLNNTFKYSSIISVNNRKGNGALQLYPIPAKDQVVVEHGEASSNSYLNLSTMDGKLVKRFRLGANSTQTSINVSMLKAGIYIIQYNNGSEKSQSIKLIKY